jgi:hypothetical protein
LSFVAQQVDAKVFRHAIEQYAAKEEEDKIKTLLQVPQYLELVQVAHRALQLSKMERSLRAGDSVIVEDGGVCVWGQIKQVHQHAVDGEEFQLQADKDCKELLGAVKAAVPAFKSQWDTNPRIWWTVSSFRVVLCKNPRERRH